MQQLKHDEDLLEQLFWEFDKEYKRSGDIRFVFKGKMRWYAQKYARQFKEVNSWELVDDNTKM